MRNVPNVKINQLRIRTGALVSEDSSGNNGAFMVPWRGNHYGVLCSDGMGWDHVSVSLPDRCPTWDEMTYITQLFFKDDETVMQLHVPPVEHMNNHPFCLHLWRPQDQDIPKPPPGMVGSKDKDQIKTMRELWDRRWPVEEESK